MGGSSGPAYHTSSCPEPAELLTASLELEGKPQGHPGFTELWYLNASEINDRVQRFGVIFLRPPKGSTEGAS